MEANIRWRGENSHGEARSGALYVDTDVAKMIEQRFKSGWRSLTFTRNGEEIGGIRKHLDTGRRMWWAELGTNA